MSNIDQMHKSNELQQQAIKFLQEKNIEKTLSIYGEVVYTGSYAADLMVWPDIDIQLVLPTNANKVETILNVSRVLLEDCDLKNINLINFSKRKKIGMPRGMCMGISMHDKSANLLWKIDVWALEEEHYLSSREFHKELMSKLTPELKSLIISWKYKLMGEHDRVPHLGSYYLYKAILFDNITRDADIHKYLIDAGVKF